MVSSGNVSNDSSSLDSLISNYSSSVESLGGSWQGDSYDNFVEQTGKFRDEIKSAKDNLVSFSEACSAYETFLSSYDNYKEVCITSQHIPGLTKDEVKKAKDDAYNEAKNAAEKAFNIFSSIKWVDLYAK